VQADAQLPDRRGTRGTNACFSRDNGQGDETRVTRNLIRTAGRTAYRLFSCSANTAVSEFLILALLGMIVMIVAAR
jgi:hypothetical protein